MSRNDFRPAGLFAAVTTPFRDDDAVDALGFEENLRRLEAYPIDGYLVAGTTGEMSLLTPAERVHLTRIARNTVDPARAVITGVPGDSVTVAVGEALEVIDAGAGAVLLGAPAAFKRHRDGAMLRRFFLAVGARALVPVILYSNPDAPCGELPLDVILDVLGHAHMVGVKDSSGNRERMRALVANRGDDASVLIGSARLHPEAVAAGADGGVLALASLYPAEYAALHALARKREEDAETSRHVARALDFFGTYGIPGLKAALDAAGGFGGSMRAPFADAPDDVRAEAASLIAEAPPAGPGGAAPDRT